MNNVPPELPIPGLEFYGEWKSSKKLHHLPRHKNDGLEIVLISKGEVRWAIEGREVELGANTFFYTLPWQEHGGVEETQASCEISYFCVNLAETYARPPRRLRFHPAFGFRPDEEKVISSAFTARRVQTFPANGEATWLLGHFFQITGGPPRLRASRARDVIKLLLTNLAAGRRESQSRPFEAERRVREFASLLAARHVEPWTLDAMSEACGLARTQFACLLKKHTGDTPVTYLNRLRIHEAQRLLAVSRRSITEIALATGFSSSQYFATVFKEFTDVDARSYRASCSGGL